MNEQLRAPTLSHLRTVIVPARDISILLTAALALAQDERLPSDTRLSWMTDFARISTNVQEQLPTGREATQL